MKEYNKGKYPRMRVRRTSRANRKADNGGSSDADRRASYSTSYKQIKSHSRQIVSNRNMDIEGA